MKTKDRGGALKRFRLDAAKRLAIGFILLILVGAALLSLPCAARSGESVGFFDALFTSTSAVCVTGLTVRDTGLIFSRFGHVTLLILIQSGGLGFMTMATMLFMLMGRRISLGDRILIQESMSGEGPGGMVRLIRWVVLCTLVIELCGAVLLAIRFIPDYGWGEGLFFALFHAVSAFCNAGFDLFGGGVSLTPFALDPLVNLTVMMLIALGGLGFGVMSDVAKKRDLKRCTLHTKLVLTMTAALLALGFAMTLAAEWTNPKTLADLGAPGKALAALFHSVTLRTAGFNTIDLAGLRPVTKLISGLLMFVGAAPASTGGGIKVTTVAVMLLMVRATAKGRDETEAFGRGISRQTVRRAMAVVLIGLGVLLADLSLLCALEGARFDALDLFFECASALGTVGVSSVGTANLGAASRVVIMITMFIGRVGPLTVALAIARKQSAGMESMKYPEERVMVG